MEIMFVRCTNFNQPLNNWNVSRVTSMRAMFEDCTSFNQDLSTWNIDRVRNFSGMFRGCTSLTINPNWQFHRSSRGFENMYNNTSLQAPREVTAQQRAERRAEREALARVREERRAEREAEEAVIAERIAEIEAIEAARPPRPAPQPAGVAWEIHNAFPELNFRKFMTIVRKDNNGASNFKDASYPLQPLITYINNDKSTTIVDTVNERTKERIPEKTNLTRDLNGEIKTRLNMYLSEHPESKDSVMEMIQFIMSQGPDYKDPYIRFLAFDCVNAYGPGGASCTKGVFERVFLINKSVLIPLCSDDTSSSASSSASSTASSAATCKPVYRELLGCFYPDMDLNALFGEWYAINNLEEGTTSPLANASEEERKEDFRRFVLRKVPRADPTAINNYIDRNENTFKTLLIGGRRKRSKSKKIIKRRQNKTMKRRKNKTMKKQKGSKKISVKKH
jgi:surface protein